MLNQSGEKHLLDLLVVIEQSSITVEPGEGSAIDDPRQSLHTGRRPIEEVVDLLDLHLRKLII